MVCETGLLCVCPFGGKSGECIPACQGPGDCGPDEACSSGHCVAKPCTSDADCPESNGYLFACSSAHVCGAKACTTDADCGAQFCVNGTCNPKQGMCVEPAA
jgi:hypothetical protein